LGSIQGVRPSPASIAGAVIWRKSCLSHHLPSRIAPELPVRRAAEELSGVIRLPVQPGVIAEGISKGETNGMTADVDSAMKEMQDSVIERARKLCSERVLSIA